MSVRLRIIVAVLLATLAIISISGLAGVLFVSRNIEKSQTADLALISDIADHFISTEIVRLKQMAEQFADTLSRAEPEAWDGLLAELAEGNPEILGQAVLRRGVGPVAGAGALPASTLAMEDGWVQRAFGGAAQISSTIPTATQYGVVFYLAAPLPGSDDHAVVLTLPGMHFALRLSSITVWETGHIFIDDAEGHVIANTRPEWVQNRQNFIKMAAGDDQYAGVARVIRRGVDGETGTDRFTIDGVLRLCTFTPISGSDEGWFLGVIAPLSESPFRYTNRGLIVIGAVSMVLSLAAAFIASGPTSKLFKQVDELRELAEAHSRAKSDFLANMSHEIRTPMNAIIGMTAIGKDADSLGRAKSCLGKIEEASQHLLGVINDILDMSKIEAGKLSLSPIEFDFEKALRRVVGVMKFRSDEKQQRIMVHIDPSIPAFLHGDDQRLLQVITNLMGNAVKFTPEGGLITLDAKLSALEGDRADILIAVADTGIGMNESQQACIFESFAQAEHGTTRKYGGTGLGLSISKSIVEMMGGTIWVNSAEGQGSVFSFTVRMQKSDKAYIPIRMDAERMKNTRVLIADNETDVLEYFEEIIHRFGMPCDTALSGPEALALVEQKGSYDICFVDWKMPCMNGIELTRALRERSGSASIVIMTAADIREHEDEAREAGADRFLTKPIFASTIADVISDLQGLSMPVDDGAQPDTDGIFRGRRALVAEDMEINREIVQAFLEPTLLEMDFANDGVEAVEMFRRNPKRYDMIFMDIQMPEMDGYAATKLIREMDDIPESRTIPIVAMTANVYKEDIDKCIAAGMDDHVGKPMDLGEVVDVLRKCFSAGK